MPGMETYLDGFAQAEMAGTYTQLVDIFTAFREFGAPTFDARGVPDYSAPAMAAQHERRAANSRGPGGPPGPLATPSRTSWTLSK